MDGPSQSRKSKVRSTREVKIKRQTARTREGIYDALDHALMLVRNQPQPGWMAQSKWDSLRRRRIRYLTDLVRLAEGAASR